MVGGSERDSRTRAASAHTAGTRLNVVGDRRERERVNAVFWDKIDEVVYEASDSAGLNGLTFQDYEMNLLDFGAWSPLRLHLPSDLQVELDRYREAALRCELLLLSRFLFRQHKIYRKGRDTGRVPAVEESLHRLEEYIIGLKQKRQGLLSAERVSADRRTRIENASREVEDVIIEGLSLQCRALRDGADRVKLSLLKAQYEGARKNLHDLMQGLPQPGKLEVLNKKIEECYKRLFKLRRTFAESHALMAQTEAQVTVADVKSRMEDEVRILRSFVQMNAAGAGAGAFSPLTDVALLPSPDAVRAAADVEPAMQTQPEPPAVLLVPSNGTGTYDWNQNLLLIPTQPKFDIAKTVNDALGGYRRHLKHSKPSSRRFFK